MTERKKKAVHLQGEDRVRAVRLHEETTSRLVELSLIAARALGKEAPSLSRLTFKQVLRRTSSGSGELLEEVSGSVTVFWDGDTCVGAYEDPPGICRPCEPGD